MPPLFTFCQKVTFMPRYHPPSWWPYAEEILQRLSWTIALKDSDRPSYRLDEVRSAPDAEPPELTGEEVAIPQHLDSAEVTEPKVKPSPLQVSLALRLAASFGSRDSFLRCMNSGAITVLGNMAPGEIGALFELLRLAFLPPGCQICTKPLHIEFAGGVRPRILRLVPETDNDEIGLFALRKFHERIAAALCVAAPVLILLPDEAAPGQELARYLPPPVPLAPVGREIMLQHLRITYEEINEDAIFDAMPTDQALVGLTTIALNVALRAPDATEAARRLREFLQPDREPRDAARLGCAINQVFKLLLKRCKFLSFYVLPIGRAGLK